jgi:hypothetical protein
VSTHSLHLVARSKEAIADRREGVTGANCQKIHFKLSGGHEGTVNCLVTGFEEVLHETFTTLKKKQIKRYHGPEFLRC